MPLSVEVIELENRQNKIFLFKLDFVIYTLQIPTCFPGWRQDRKFIEKATKKHFSDEHRLINYLDQKKQIYGDSQSFGL